MKKILLFILFFSFFLIPNIVLAQDEIKNEEVNANIEDNSNKEYNNYLKSLEIEGYELSFNKHISIYEITIDKNVNSLNIKAEAESNKSKIEIKGADNLSVSNDKILIEVTSGKGEVKTYVINIKRLEEKKEKKDGFILDITDEQKNTALLFGCIIIGVGLLIFIIIKIKDRKIDKQIDKM